MKKFYNMLVSVGIASMILLSSMPVYATQPVESTKETNVQLPSTIILEGREFVMDISAGGGRDTAEPDKSMFMPRGILGLRSAYKVIGSDVRLYVDYSHGRGGDHFASGWVKATAPKFTARAEVWENGRLNTTGPNAKNSGDTATATSYLATGIVKNATPHIFYKW